MFWKRKSEVEKVLAQYGKPMGTEFLTLFHTFTTNALALQKKPDGNACNYAKAFINRILDKYGQSYLNEYSNFYKNNSENVQLIAELQLEGTKYFDASITSLSNQTATSLEPVHNDTPPVLSKVSNPDTAITAPRAASKAIDSLGRDESKHLSCDYEGNENDCPFECSKCAIAIKTDGDLALTQNKAQEAIRYYKKAVFVEPQFAEAWCNLGNSYGMISEYNNALLAFDKAIAIDHQYGKALFGKAITLQNIGRINEALSLANSILNLYEDTNVEAFKEKLIFTGARDEKRTLYSANALQNLLMNDDENELEIDIEIIHELSKIEDEIQHIENKLGQSHKIRFEESKKANVSFTDHERDQRSSIINLQKRFNRILEEYGLNTIIAKQIIDTFDDFKWYDEEKEHYWLEKVEIDVKKRLKSTEFKRKCIFLAENSVFAFYLCNQVILRESRNSGEVVYFGTGSGVIGSILGNKFYWFDGTSICGDNMIYRADFDRSTVEHLDWISNEKAWLSGHLMSEDRVSDMHTVGSKLIISVLRQSEHGGEYRIVVSERNEKLYVTKELVEGNFDI